MPHKRMLCIFFPIWGGESSSYISRNENAKAGNKQRDDFLSYSPAQGFILFESPPTIYQSA